MGVIFRNGVAYGGSISIPIEAEERQTVIGNGEQRGIGGSYFDLFISNEDSESGKDEYFLSGLIQQGSYHISSSFSFGGGLSQIHEKTIERNGQQVTVKEFSPQCHIKVSDFAKAEFDGSSWFGVHGESIFDIGENVAGSPGFTLWQNEQDRSTSLIYPKAFIHNAAYLVIDDGFNHLGPPVSIIHGGFYCDISDTQPQNPIQRLCNPYDPNNYSVGSTLTGNYSNPRENYYPSCPWTTNGDWENATGPILFLHQSPTIMMEHSPVLSMRGTSVIQTEGQARLYMDATDNRKTIFNMMNGSLFKMGAAGNGYTALGAITDQQIFFGKGPANAGYNFGADTLYSSRNLYGGITGYAYQSKSFNASDGSAGNFVSDNDNISSERTFPYFHGWKTYSNPNDLGPQFLIETESGTHAGICYSTGSGSEIHEERQAQQGSFIMNSIEAQGSSSIGIAYKAGSGAEYIKDVSPQTGSKTGIQIKPNAGALTTFMIQPSGFTSILFQPINKFRYIENARDYKYISHVEKYEEYVDGNIFKQFSGASHIEVQDGASIILRAYQTMEKYEDGHNNKSWNCPVQSDCSPRIQLYDSSNFLMRGSETGIVDGFLFSIYQLNFPELFNIESFVTEDQTEIQSFISRLSPNDSFFTKQSNLSAEYSQITPYRLEINETKSETEKEMRIMYKTIPLDGISIETSHLERTNSPVVEFNDQSYLFMTGRSELKLEDGSIIKAKSNNGTIEYIFGDEADNSNQVVFTINDLKALKTLIQNT